MQQPSDVCWRCCSQVGSKSSGTWYRGSIKAVAQAYHNQRDFNPWESITVEWDYDDGRWGALRAAAWSPLARAHTAVLCSEGCWHWRQCTLSSYICNKSCL
jgi:hypothetical protein